MRGHGAAAGLLPTLERTLALRALEKEALAKAQRTLAAEGEFNRVSSSYLYHNEVRPILQVKPIGKIIGLFMVVREMAPFREPVSA